MRKWVQGPGKGMILVVVVSVMLALGCQPRTVQVPDVVGMTQAAAEQTIRDAGLQVGDIFERHSDTVPVGVVMEQMPEAGAATPRVG